jgi:hypothetical protein
MVGQCLPHHWMKKLFFDECDSPTKCCFPTPEFPWEGAQGNSSILQLWSANIATKVFNMHTIVGKEGIVGKLVGRIREQDLHIFFPELVNTLVFNSLPVL